MDAVGALAPSVFEGVGLAPMVFANFSHITINFHTNDLENVTNTVIPCFLAQGVSMGSN